MNKNSKWLIIALVVSFCLVGCNNTQNNNNGSNNNNQNQIDQSINNSNNNIDENHNDNQSNSKVEENTENDKTFNVADEMKKVESLTSLDDTSKMTKEEINEKYNLGKYKDLPMEVRSEITENSLKEIVLIKIDENEQSSDLILIMLSRLDALKKEYRENRDITKILNNPENMILKQQNGVLTFIIAENAKAVEAELNK